MSECIICGAEFVSHRGKFYCSPKCAKRNRAMRDQEEMRAKRRQIPTMALEVRCPMCSADVMVLNEARSGWDRRYLVQCNGPTKCRYQFVVSFSIMHARIDDEGNPTRCGTEAGSQRHYRMGEELCVPCSQAHAEAQSLRKQNRQLEVAR